MTLHTHCPCGGRWVSELVTWDNFELQGEMWFEECPDCGEEWMIELRGVSMAHLQAGRN